MTIDLTPVLQAVIGLLAALITCRLVPWIQARTTNEQQALLQATIRTLVFAAEQIYGAGKGNEKMQYVLDELSNRGYQLDTAAIEAAVKQMSRSV